MEDKIQKLELKITELENKLKELGASSAPEIDPEDMKIYKKVSDQLSAGKYYPCSICTTICSICKVCKICTICINECTCGPCIQYTPGGTQGEGFSNFM